MSKVYRFELAFEDEPQGVGMLQGLEDVGLSTRSERLLYEMFVPLKCPELPDLCDPVSFWFTEKGLVKFSAAIGMISDLISKKSWSLLVAQFDASDFEMRHTVYKDDDQVAWTREFIFQHFHYEPFQGIEVLRKGAVHNGIHDNSWHFIEPFTSEQDEKETIERFRPLHDLLLSIGGYQTVFPVIEEDMKAIMERGYYRKGTSKMMKGSPGQCHTNTCELYKENRRDKDVRICTGYALSEDGLWRQHSWLLHTYKTNTQTRTRVIETTAKRVAYFGFEMTPEEADEFCYHNL